MAKILVIDDSEFICKAIKAILTSDDRMVIYRLNAKEGIKAIKEKSPDLILLDVNLPDVDGYTLCRYIKTNSSMNHIPVMFITYRSDSKETVKGFEAGAIDYVNKPFCELELKVRVTAHLNSKFMQDRLQAINEQLMKALEEKRQLSIKDPLTQLYNRRYLWEQIEAMYNQSSSYQSSCLIMGDIDKFKMINDKYGHLAGDYILQRTSQIIKDTVLKYGISGRFGGEEFLVILPEIKLEDAMRIAENIRVNVQNAKYEFNNRKILCTITLGVSEIDFSIPIESNIQIADECLYLGKKLGRNCIVRR